MIICGCEIKIVMPINKSFANENGDHLKELQSDDSLPLITFRRLQSTWTPTLRFCLLFVCVSYTPSIVGNRYMFVILLEILCHGQVLYFCVFFMFLEGENCLEGLAKDL